MRLDLLTELDKGFVRDRSFTWPVMTIGSNQDNLFLGLIVDMGFRNPHRV
jgi:hypothetical protein